MGKIWRGTTRLSKENLIKGLSLSIKKKKQSHEAEIVFLWKGNSYDESL
jgi:hypothetical protein